MGFLTDAHLLQQADLPLNLPETGIIVGDWLTLATIKIADPQRLVWQWTQLSLNALYPDADTPTPQTTWTARSGTSAIVFVAAYLDYAGQDPVILTPASGIIAKVNAAPQSPLYAPVVDGYTAPPITLTAAGTYTFIIVNNTTNRWVRVNATGQVRLYLA